MLGRAAILLIVSTCNAWSIDKTATVAAPDRKPLTFSGRSLSDGLTKEQLDAYCAMDQYKACCDSCYSKAEDCGNGCAWTLNTNAYSCDETCFTNCDDGCVGGCNDGCVSSCDDGGICYSTSCDKGCWTSCDKGWGTGSCDGSCTGGCDGSNCDVGTSCDSGCVSGCDDDCISSCDEGCTTGCDQNCEGKCTEEATPCFESCFADLAGRQLLEQGSAREKPSQQKRELLFMGDHTWAEPILEEVRYTIQAMKDLRMDIDSELQAKLDALLKNNAADAAPQDLEKGQVAEAIDSIQAIFMDLESRLEMAGNAKVTDESSEDVAQKIQERVKEVKGRVSALSNAFKRMDEDFGRDDIED